MFFGINFGKKAFPPLKQSQTNSSQANESPEGLEYKPSEARKKTVERELNSLSECYSDQSATCTDAIHNSTQEVSLVHYSCNAKKKAQILSYMKAEVNKNPLLKKALTYRLNHAVISSKWDEARSALTLGANVDYPDRFKKYTDTPSQFNWINQTFKPDAFKYHTQRSYQKRFDSEWYLVHGHTFHFDDNGAFFLELISYTSAATLNDFHRDGDTLLSFVLQTPRWTLSSRMDIAQKIILRMSSEGLKVGENNAIKHARAQGLPDIATLIEQAIAIMDYANSLTSGAIIFRTTNLLPELVHLIDEYLHEDKPEIYLNLEAAMITISRYSRENGTPEFQKTDYAGMYKYIQTRQY